ncbi:MAG TPA: adenylate/guanylate cyclase domain-containing protein, partial [Afifellaceae bacterium]|nr:adenylate/guanylate cyclase domain-containing protein [Afifellaceae bacterium]
YVMVMTIVAGPVISLMTGSIVSGGLATGTWLAYKDSGLLIDPTFPLAGSFFVYLSMTSIRYFTSDRQKRQIRRAFSQDVAPTVLQQIEKTPDALALGGEMRDVTIMFTDVRNFTGLSERLPPVELVMFLNGLLGRLSEQIIQERGTIDKFIGDSIMAFWNAPLDTPDHQLMACRAALRMREALAHFNSETGGLPNQKGDGREPIAIGIGINTGEACVGNMGSQSRFDYSVIGDAVNIASRVESACKHVGYDIVLSHTTAEAVTDLALLDAGSVALKGKSEMEPVYALVGDETVAETAEFKRLANAHTILLEAAGRSGSGWESRLLTCKDLARPVNAELVGFYDLLPSRLEDFRRAAVESPVRLSAGAGAS